MRCPNCGLEVEGGFCPACGASLGQETTVLSQSNNPFLQQPQSAHQQGAEYPAGGQGWTQQPCSQPGLPAQPYAQPVQTYAQPVQSFQPVQPVSLAEPPAVGIVRKHAGSVRYLLAALAFTGQLVLLAIRFAEAFTALRELASGWERNIGWVPVLIVGAVLLLLDYAVWINYFTAHRAGRKRMTTSGLSTIGAIAAGTLGVIILALSAAFLYFIYLLASDGIDKAVGELIGLIGPWLSDLLVAYGLKSGDSGKVFDLLLVAYAGLSVVAILFFAALFQTVKTVKGTVISGTPDARVSLLVTVFCFLLAAGSGYLALSMIRAEDWALAAAWLLGAICQLLFGMILLRYRFAMQKTNAYQT